MPVTLKIFHIQLKICVLSSSFFKCSFLFYGIKQQFLSVSDIPAC